MNDSFNYSGFIEMFLKSSDEFEPYGCIDDLPPSADIRRNPHTPAQPREKLILDPGED